MNLPIDLQRAVENELQNKSLRDVSKIVERISQRYRAGVEEQDNSFVRSEEDAIAYAVYRLPATFAAVRSTLNEVRARLTEWQPRSLLDVGSGTGTAMWAAIEIWPALERITLIEKEESMIKIAKRLVQHAKSQAIRNAIWRKVDLTASWQVEPHDLVVASHVLGELPQAKQKEFVNQLWSCTHGTLLIIEPAKSSRGFKLILQARDQLIASGANVVAPCPHANLCPMTGNSWCHFAQRVERTRAHRIVKKGFRPYEDVKFSYIAVSRQKGSTIKGRLIRQPQHRPGHINLELCTPEELQHLVVPKREKEMFRYVRKLNWGAAITEGPPEKGTGSEE